LHYHYSLVNINFSSDWQTLHRRWHRARSSQAQDTKVTRPLTRANPIDIPDPSDAEVLAPVDEPDDEPVADPGAAVVTLFVCPGAAVVTFFVCPGAAVFPASGFGATLPDASFNNPVPLTSSVITAMPPSDVTMTHSAALEVRHSTVELARTAHSGFL